jgi:hypothetical protein
MASRQPPAGARGTNARFAQFKLVLLGMLQDVGIPCLTSFGFMAYLLTCDIGESAVGKVYRNDSL